MLSASEDVSPLLAEFSFGLSPGFTITEYLQKKKKKLLETPFSIKVQQGEVLLACSRLSVSGDDRKSARATSGTWMNSR